MRPTGYISTGNRYVIQEYTAAENEKMLNNVYCRCLYYCTGYCAAMPFVENIPVDFVPVSKASE